MEVISIRKVAGVEVPVFTPTKLMKMYAMTAFCDPAVVGKSPEMICLQAGIAETTFRTFLKYEPYFSEWLEERRAELGGKNKRALLEAVGMDKALEGDFQFWKPIAQREGVIGEDKLTIGLDLPANLSAFEEMNDEDLKSLRNSLMGSLRSVENGGAIDMVEGPQGWQPESDPAGIDKVPEGQVALPARVDPDRERALEDLESF